MKPQRNPGTAANRMSRLAFRSIRATAVLLLAACQSGGPKDYAEFHAAQDPVHVADRIADNVGACWIKGRAAFVEYTYASELTSYANRPRVLIVPKKDPHGLPKLVIDFVNGVNTGKVFTQNIFGMHPRD